MDQGNLGLTENNREAKLYAITKPGLKAMGEETLRWKRMAGLVDRRLAEESRS